MGTNYYATLEGPCECCGRGGESLHIGKSSGGWEFLFAPYPEHGLTTHATWMAFLKGREIKDEYGDTVELETLKATIAIKQGGWNARTAPMHAWGSSSRDGFETVDPEGYRFATTPDFS